MALFNSPSDDEVRQSDDEGANGHQYTTHCDDLWPVELGPKVTDESYHQQVTCGDGGRQKYQGFRVLLYIRIKFDFEEQNHCFITVFFYTVGDPDSTLNALFFFLIYFI